MRSQSTVPVAAPRHPFRARIVPIGRVTLANPDDGDLKLFVLSFTAFFICFYTMIF